MAGQKKADSQQIWIEGTFVPYESAKIHLLSHSLHYGTGMFEGVRAYKTYDKQSAIFRGNEHFVRLLDSMSILGFVTHYAPSDLLKAAVECVRINGLDECYIRPIVYLDDSVRGLRLPLNPKANIAIAVWPWGKYMGEDGQRKGVRVMISTFRRAAACSSLPMAKITGGYLTSVLSSREALQNGFEEALLLDPQGFIAEGPGENIFMVVNNELITPQASFILPGITRDTTMQLARHFGLRVTESAITRNQLYLADEAFFTGTAVEITPIREIDHRPIGNGTPGPITLKLLEAYYKCVRGELSEFRHWLT